MQTWSIYICMFFVVKNLKQTNSVIADQIYCGQNVFWHNLVYQTFSVHLFFKYLAWTVCLWSQNSISVRKMWGHSLGISKQHHFFCLSHSIVDLLFCSDDFHVVWSNFFWAFVTKICCRNPLYNLKCSGSSKKQTV